MVDRYAATNDYLWFSAEKMGQILCSFTANIIEYISSLNDSNNSAIGGNLG